MGYGQNREEDGKTQKINIHKYITVCIISNRSATILLREIEIMHWLFYCLLTILLYGLHDVILKHLAGSTNATVASIIINISASAGILIFLAIKYFCSANRNFVKIAPFSFYWLVLAGLCLGLATITFMKSFSLGGEFSIVISMVYSGIIVASLLIGYFLFKESINITKLLGIAFSVIGIILLVRK